MGANAPHLQSKHADLDVRAVDNAAQFVIPVLSGHLGGANAYAEQLAKLLGVTAVVTSASDVGDTISVEVVPGSSALSTCAFLVGTPVTHDFCTISLSDLLTPWPVIARRLEASERGNRDMRHFTPGAQINEAVLVRILEAANMAPSVGLTQPWRFVRILDETLRKRSRIA